MSRSRPRSVPDGPLSEEKECDPDRFATLLADDAARAMLARADEPVTVGELAVELELPPSTAYRKVATLCEAGLLTEIRRFRNDNEPEEYVRAFDSVSVVHGDSTSVECVTKGIVICRTEG